MPPVLRYDPPRDAIETQIATIWAQALGFARVGVHDHLNEWVNSMQAAETVLLISNQFRLHDASQDLLRLGTVAEQAAFVRARLAR